MSLVDDQVIREERYNALDELGKRINRVPVKDVSAGINETAKFINALERASNVRLVSGELKKEECIDGTVLVNEIMSDMGVR